MTCVNVNYPLRGSDAFLDAHNCADKARRSAGHVYPKWLQPERVSRQ